MYDAMIRCDVKNCIYDVSHDTSLTVMVLLLPCISVERASNIVPFNAASLMFHYSFAVFRGVVGKISASWW